MLGEDLDLLPLRLGEPSEPRELGVSGVSAFGDADRVLSRSRVDVVSLRCTGWGDAPASSVMEASS